MTPELLHELADLFDAEAQAACVAPGAGWLAESNRLEALADEIRKRAYAHPREEPHA